MQARLTDFRELTAREITGLDCNYITQYSVGWNYFLMPLISACGSPDMLVLEVNHQEFLENS